MIEIRQELPIDYPAVASLTTLAFGQSSEARIIENLRKLNSFKQELSLVAVLEDKVVGHILFSPVTIQSESNFTEALILGPMSVLQEYQRQGIGSDLVRHGLATCKSLNHTIVIVVGHPEYYPRFGFQIAKSFNISLSFSVPEEAFMAIELKEGALQGVSGVVELPSAFETE